MLTSAAANPIPCSGQCLLGSLCCSFCLPPCAGAGRRCMPAGGVAQRHAPSRPGAGPAAQLPVRRRRRASERVLRGRWLPRRLRRVRRKSAACQGLRVCLHRAHLPLLRRRRALTAYCQGNVFRNGFGECVGKMLPPRLEGFAGTEYAYSCKGDAVATLRYKDKTYVRPCTGLTVAWCLCDRKEIYAWIGHASCLAVV